MSKRFVMLMTDRYGVEYGPDPAMKTCSKCLEAKPLDCYSKGSRPDGKQPWCKMCMAEYKKINSDKHNAYNRIWHYKNPDNLTERSNRRRARVKKLICVPYKRADVFTRDKWMCYLCLVPIDRQLRYPDPMSKSVDHVTPLALGGADSFDNVGAVHLRCNKVKGFRLLTQG